MPVTDRIVQSLSSIFPLLIALFRKYGKIEKICKMYKIVFVNIEKPLYKQLY